ncbi:MAG: type I 3-dehydroquinate dehydratase, partial [Planctomycetota bacterium]
MTLIATPLQVERADGAGAALERAARAAEAGADLIEWRVDELVDAEPVAAAVAATSRLVGHSPRPCIVTCRPDWEGGAYGGPEAQRWGFFASLLAASSAAGGGAGRPRYLDLELTAAQRAPDRFAELTAALGEETTLILSAHDFTGRPADLLRRLEAMAREPACGVIKLAWQARSLRDNLEALDLLAARPKPMIALCMGRFGLASRVLAPKRGGLLTFAADEDGGGTAPGQPTLAELRERYRFDSIGPATRVYGVIGWPAEHSRGPDLHNAGFAAVGHDGVYLPLPVPPETVHLKATLAALLEHEGLGFAGASVTLPHKEHLVAVARELGGRADPLVELVGAANTIVIDADRRPTCLNTDCPAVVDALCAGMGVDRDELRDRRVAVLGAGGAARAAAVGLATAGANVVLFNRTAGRAEALAGDLGARLAETAGAGTVTAGGRGGPDGLARGGFGIIVNCTAVGMAGGPAPDGSPLSTLSDEPVPLGEPVTVLDTVYTPAETPLLRAAAAAGARTIGGIEMFL